jgi:hypothetical protein
MSNPIHLRSVLESGFSKNFQKDAAVDPFWPRDYIIAPHKVVIFTYNKTRLNVLFFVPHIKLKIAQISIL